MSEQNLSCVLAGAGRVTFESRPVPQLRDPFDVRVRVKYTGVCGSDVHFWVHGAIGDAVITAPMIMGHEASGTVESVGRAVTHLRAGDRVALEPGTPCRRCPRCRDGRYHLCAGMRFAASPPNDGTLTGYYVLPADFCYRLPDHLSLEEGAVLEPLAVAIHMVRLARVGLGTSVVVFGCGPVGLLCGAAARAFGAECRVMVDIVVERVRFAEGYVATGVFLPSLNAPAGENAARLKSEQGLGEGADVVIDASGAQASIQTGILVLKNGGVFVQGGLGSDEVAIPITAVCKRELDIKGSFRYGPGDFELGMKMLATGKVSVKELITDVVDFIDAPQAWETVRASRGIKTLIRGLD